jgi:hypothetical protein
LPLAVLADLSLSLKFHFFKIKGVKNIKNFTPFLFFLSIEFLYQYLYTHQYYEFAFHFYQMLDSWF